MRPQQKHRLPKGDFAAPAARARAAGATRSEGGQAVALPEPLLAVTDASEWAFLQKASGPRGYGNDVRDVFARLWKRGRKRRYLRGASQQDPDAAWEELRAAQRSLYDALVEAGALPELLARPLSSRSDLAPMPEYAAAGVLSERLLTPDQQQRTERSGGTPERAG